MLSIFGRWMGAAVWCFVDFRRLGRGCCFCCAIAPIGVRMGGTTCWMLLAMLKYYSEYIERRWWESWRCVGRILGVLWGRNLNAPFLPIWAPIRAMCWRWSKYTMANACSLIRQGDTLHWNALWRARGGAKGWELGLGLLLLICPHLSRMWGCFGMYYCLSIHIWSVNNSVGVWNCIGKELRCGWERWGRKKCVNFCCKNCNRWLCSVIIKEYFMS